MSHHVGPSIPSKRIHEYVAFRARTQKKTNAKNVSEDANTSVGILAHASKGSTGERLMTRL